MSALLTSRDAVLRPAPAQDYREEVVFSASDAARYGVGSYRHGILRTTHLIPDVPGREYAVRFVIGVGGETPPNTLLVNSLFYEELRFTLGQEWSLSRADRYQPIRSLALEPSLEQERLRDDLRRLQRKAFVGRCLLAQPGAKVADLSLRLAEQAYFNVHDIAPWPERLSGPTVFGIEEGTEVNIFVPHRKGGIDMVIVVDASNSMDVMDYVDRTGSVQTRIQGARRALGALLQRRMHEGGRVSRLALVAFGKDARLVYPLAGDGMAELTSLDVDAMRREVPNLARRVTRDGSNVAEAMDLAAELLYRNAREDNEKVIVLLSDGAHWVENQDTGFQIEVRVGHEDAVMFADNLYDEGQIRVHTVAISNEENVRRHRPDLYGYDQGKPEGQRVWTPNPKMLNEIARRTRAKFFESPDADVLEKLFDDLGRGAIFPVH